MSRLIVVSNRVAIVDEGKPAAGGLAVAVHAALKDSGGIWFGWNGEVSASPAHKPDILRQDGLVYATFPMTRRDYNEYYAGYSNSSLWPVCHSRLDLAHFDRREYRGYERVNARFAKLLFPLLRVDDTIWIHDYHLIPLARELRKSGSSHPIGFFLHIPLPSLEIMLAVPQHRELMEALCQFDLLGFQTVNDLAAFHDYIALEAGGEILDDNRVRCFGRTLRAEAFPIGIDTEDVAHLAQEHDDSVELRRLMATLGDRRMIVGVDRLDYSKGLVQRFQSFERLLETYPSQQGAVTLLQIAPPSRENVGGYNEIRVELETSAGHINGRFADFDWVPIRYLNKSFDRGELTCFYRHAAIGLVTPLKDGMNLVAKEYIAAQNPVDPGVLVLSRFAGARHELEGALSVNPYDIDGVAAAMAQALEMPIEERRARWEVDMDRLRRHDIHAWRTRFMDALAAAATARNGSG